MKYLEYVIVENRKNLELLFLHDLEKCIELVNNDLVSDPDYVFFVTDFRENEKKYVDYLKGVELSKRQLENLLYYSSGYNVPVLIRHILSDPRITSEIIKTTFSVVQANKNKNKTAKIYLEFLKKATDKDEYIEFMEKQFDL